MLRLSPKMPSGVLALIVELAAVICAPPLYASSPENDALLRRVITLYRANRAAITSLQCTYFFDLDGAFSRECHYSRQASKFHHASLMRSGSSLGMPDELAWDGQRMYHRSRMNYMRRSVDRSSAKPAAPPPEDAIGEFLHQAYGIDPQSDRQYRLSSAKEYEENGSGNVELTFDVLWNDGKLVVRHAKRYGYWPVYAQLRNREGEVVYELTEVRYAESVADGNKLYYPTRFVQRSFPDTAKAATLRYRVDEKTLKINQPIPDQRFRLEPWPGEEVADADRGIYVRAADPNWVADGRVGFPFKYFLYTSGARATAPADGSVPAISAKTAPTARTPGEDARIYSLLIYGGGLFLIVAGTWTVLRKRRSTNASPRM